MLTKRLAIVTGGGQRIGRAICLRLANDGVRIAVTDRDFATAEEAA